MKEDLQLYEAYFKQNISYYSERCVKFKNGQQISFNVFAFLFGLFWFMYRKMYFESFVLILAIVAEAIFEALVFPGDEGNAFSVIITVIIATGTGLSGNYFYFRKTERMMRTAKARFPDAEQQKMFLRRRGGVSYLFMIAIAVIVAIFFVYNNYLTANIG